jgi:hypothetical protein
MARPPKEINWDSVEKRMQAGNNAKQICKDLRIDIDTFYRRFREEYGCSFGDYSVGMPECKKGNLEYIMYSKAMSGDVKMLIHLAKFELGHNDKADIQDEVQKQLLPFLQQFKDTLPRNPVQE